MASQRLTFARVVATEAVQTKGLGAWLYAAANARPARLP